MAVSRGDGAVSRRDAIASFLGVPFLLSGCGGGANDSLPAGRIVGANDAVGHRLRDGWRVEPTADAWKPSAVVIVGAGVAGLAAGWRLRRAGFDDFVILELESAPGGTARGGSDRSAPCPFPWGAHYVPAPLADDRILIELLDEMGVFESREGSDGKPVVAEQFLCRDPEERIFYKGRWYEGLYLGVGARDEDIRQWRAFETEINRWAKWRDGAGRRAFALPMAQCSRDAEVLALDRQSMAEWLDERQFTSSRLRWMVDYACRDDYGMTAAQTSAWAGLFYYAARAAGADSESQPLITWPEGNGRIIRHLHERVGDRVRCGMAVADVRDSRRPDAPGVEVVALDVAGDRPVGYRAQRALFAAPQFLARRLVAPYRQSPPSGIETFQYGAWMVANLVLSGRLSEQGFPLAWDNVLYDSPSLGYVSATYQQGMDDGPAVITYYYPLCDDDPMTARKRLLGTDWEGWAAVTLADLQRAHRDIREKVERLDVMRWGHAMIRPTPGFIHSDARVRAQQPVGAIHFAHSDLSGLPLCEEALYHGVRAAEEILGAMGRPAAPMMGESKILHS